MAREKENFLNKSLKSSSSHMHEFTEATLKYFLQLIKNARRSFASKVEGAKIIERIFGKRLHDIDFQLCLVEKFWLKDREELIFLEFASNDDIFTPGGRRFLSAEERQGVYDFWKLNSEVSVHRSSDRHIVKINLENVCQQVADLEDDNISLINTKRGEKKKHTSMSTRNVARLCIQIISKFMALKFPMAASSTCNHFVYLGQPIKKLKCVCATSV